MDKHLIFDKKYLAGLLEPFAPGMSGHIIPIKFESLTPDQFLLLFRTTAQDGKYLYFVSLETDFANSLESAKCTIEDWYEDGMHTFWPLEAKCKEADPEKVDDFRAKTSGPYFAFLAEVNCPTFKGYWSEAVSIMPGDNIGEKIKHYTEQEQAAIRLSLAHVLQHKFNPSDSVLDSFVAKRKEVTKDDINQTNISVALYVRPNAEVELFYSYVKDGDRVHKNQKA